MKIRTGVLTAVAFFVLGSYGVYAQNSLLDKVKNAIGEVNVRSEYKNLVGDAEDILSDFKNQAKSIDINKLEKTMSSAEKVLGKNSKIIKETIEKQLPDIIEGLKNQIEKTPKDTKLLLKLAIAYQFGAKYSLAITVAEKILKLEPDNFNAAMVIAQTYKLMGESEKSIKYLEKFMKEKLNNPELSGLLASLKMDMGQADSAKKELENSISKFPDSKDLYEKLAAYYDKCKDKGNQLFIEGKKIDFSKYGNVQPLIKNGVTMVPIRVAADCLKADIQYDSKSKTVIIKYKEKTIELKENETKAKINNKVKKIDAAAENIKGRIMVPLRFVSEQFSKKIEWFPYSKYGIISLK